MRGLTVSPRTERPLIDLSKLDYVKARAIPGAYYDPEVKGMVLAAVTPRAAIIALTLFPHLGDEYPELVEAREQLLQDVHPTDYATPLGLRIDAPRVHQSLLDDGHDWLEFEDEGATQETDLGYAAAILNKYGAFYLAWARGYGKTLGTCALIEANGYDRVLLAVPNTAKQDVWLRELEKRGIGGVHGTHEVWVMPNDKAKRERLLERLRAGDAPDKLVFVIHHEAIALVAKYGPKSTSEAFDGWKRIGVKWDLFACDEAHKLKNAGRKGSQVSRAAGKVPSGHRLGLSGSVYENSWEELYGPLHWFFPGRYASKWDHWNNRFFDYVEGYGKICVGILPGREQQLRDELGVFCLVREKPDKSIARREYVTLSPEQRRVYSELQSDFAVQLEDGTAIVADSGVVMLQKLRQIATGLELVSKSVVDSTKLDAAMQIIRDYPDDDFFVACWYKASAYALSDRLRRAGEIVRADSTPHVGVITGDVAQKQRGAIIEWTRQQVGSTYPDGSRRPVVLIGTIPTLGESANLQHLNHVIRIDRSFNPALNRQVVDRCDRTGQQREVRLTDIVASDTVDDLVVMPNLANKDAFRAMILGRAA